MDRRTKRAPLRVRWPARDRGPRTEALNELPGAGSALHAEVEPEMRDRVRRCGSLVSEAAHRREELQTWHDRYAAGGCAAGAQQLEFGPAASEEPDGAEPDGAEPDGAEPDWLRRLRLEQELRSRQRLEHAERSSRELQRVLVEAVCSAASESDASSELA